MTDCRVLLGPSAQRRFSGSGFALPTGVILTALHVLRDKPQSEIAVEADDAYRTVTGLEPRPTMDVALLRIDDPLPSDLRIGACAVGTRWIVTARPQDNDPQLTGTVTALDRAILNARGNPIQVLQLEVAEVLDDYAGYSGGAVRLASQPDVVVGLLCEQVHTRLRAPNAGKPRAANVLYAVPATRIAEEFGLPAVHASAPEYDTLDEIARLIDSDRFDEARRLLDRLPAAQRKNAEYWHLWARIAAAAANLDVAHRYLSEALRLDRDHAPSIALEMRVLLLRNDQQSREDARKLAESSRGTSNPLDGWLDCLAAHRVFDPGIRSATELDMLCPAPDFTAYERGNNRRQGR
jgi:hypothetical protein